MTGLPLSLYHSHPSPSSPLSSPAHPVRLAITTFLPARHRLHLDTGALGSWGFNSRGLLIPILNIIHPSFTFSLHLYTCNDTFLHPFTRPKVQSPFLFGPFPAARGLYIFKKTSSFRANGTQTNLGQGIIR